MQEINFLDNWIFRKEGEKNEHIVCIPHDAMLYEERKLNNESTGACACFTGGKYEYRKIFFAEKEWKNKHVEFFCEGIYKNSLIYLNNELVGECKYGYTSFSIDLSSKISIGKENEIVVKVDNSKMPNSRWYTGSGIYRPVSLLIGGTAYIEHQGVQIRTISLNPTIIEVNTRCHGGNACVLIRKAGKIIAETSGACARIEIENARFWSEDDPYLYECEILLKRDGKVEDRIVNKFGIRIITINKNGFFINGKSVKLRGGCVHHDNGILGAKTYKETEWRRVQKLKEMGYNAIRSSHNPCAIEMLNACDYYGMFLIDETWDVWYNRKNKYDYAVDFMDNYESDLQAMVKKDYNHPCVIMYSIGNEVGEPVKEAGQILCKKMIEILHRLDATRPVTAGYNLMIMGQIAKGKGIYKDEGGRDTKKENKQTTSSMMFNIMTNMIGSAMNNAANSRKMDKLTTPAIDLLDIAGYNYASGRYPLEGKEHPFRVIFGSETFVGDLAKNWKMVERYPYLIGDFMWTSWDYLGEAGSGAWAYTKDGRGFEKPYPWILAEMGTIDIIGNPTGEAFHAAAIWHKLAEPKIAVRPINVTGRPAKSAWRETNAIPSWSWYGCDGKKAIVEVYSDSDEVILFCNKKKIGCKKIRNGRAIFKTTYKPGELLAVTYDKKMGKTGESKLNSAVGRLSVEISPEKEQIYQNEVAYFNINIVGENGEFESNADKQLSVRIEGGELLGYGSANPRTEESYVKGCFFTYYGRSQAIIKIKDESTVKIIVSDGTDNTVYEKKILGR